MNESNPPGGARGAQIIPGSGAVARNGPLTVVAGGSGDLALAALAVVDTLDQQQAWTFEAVAAALHELVVSHAPSGVAAVLDVDDEPIVFVFDRATAVSGDLEAAGQGRAGWTTEVVAAPTVELRLASVPYTPADDETLLREGLVAGAGAVVQVAVSAQNEQPTIADDRDVTAEYDAPDLPPPVAQPAPDAPPLAAVSAAGNDASDQDQPRLAEPGNERPADLPPPLLTSLPPASELGNDLPPPAPNLPPPGATPPAPNLPAPDLPPPAPNLPPPGATPPAPDLPPPAPDLPPPAPNLPPPAPNLPPPGAAPDLPPPGATPPAPNLPPPAPNLPPPGAPPMGVPPQAAEPVAPVDRSLEDGSFDEGVEDSKYQPESPPPPRAGGPPMPPPPS